MRKYTDDIFHTTDTLYCEALDRERRGEKVSMADLTRECQRLTSYQFSDGSMRAHLGNLVHARRELGLPVMASSKRGLANAPQGLYRVLRDRHGVGGSFGKSVTVSRRITSRRDDPVISGCNSEVVRREVTPLRQAVMVEAPRSSAALESESCDLDLNFPHLSYEYTYGPTSSLTPVEAKQVSTQSSETNEEGQNTEKLKSSRHSGLYGAALGAFATVVGSIIAKM